MHVTHEVRNSALLNLPTQQKTGKQQPRHGPNLLDCDSHANTQTRCWHFGATMKPKPATPAVPSAIHKILELIRNVEGDNL